MSDRQTFILAHPEARRRAMAAVAEAAPGFVVQVRPPTRNLEQNAILHALLSDIAGRVPWAGKLRDAETWKRLCTAAWLRARGESVEVLPAIDGHGIDVVFRRTSKLTKAECSELVEFVHAWAAEHAPAAEALGAA